MHSYAKVNENNINVTENTDKLNDKYNTMYNIKDHNPHTLHYQYQEQFHNLL